jgi:hypothetical protein
MNHGHIRVEEFDRPVVWAEKAFGVATKVSIYKLQQSLYYYYSLVASLLHNGTPHL